MNPTTELVVDVVVQGLKSRSPIRTGNLRFNSIKRKTFSENDVHIYVNQKIAPYMVYTNEPWISPRWHGKKNPNEGWFDATAQMVAMDILKAFPDMELVEG